MYDWIVNIIGQLPVGSEWIYSLATIIMYIAFTIMLCSPIIAIFYLMKRRK